MPIKDQHEEEMLQLKASILRCEPGANLYNLKENPLTWGEPVTIKYNEQGEPTASYKWTDWVWEITELKSKTLGTVTDHFRGI